MKAFSQYFAYFALNRFLKNFRVKQRILVEKGRFLVKTVEDSEELAEVLRLRHEVFHREFLGRSLPLGVDTDRYDALGDHLIIVDRDTNRIVGTYRLISSRHSKDFYSASEFHLDSFLNGPEVKLEMSRACIHRDYRDGAVIALLWRGIVEYVKAVKADYLFGCASIRTMDEQEVSAIYQYLGSKGFLSTEFDVSPRADYQMPGQIDRPVPKAEERGKALIPPLLNSYLRAGAKICGKPALDADFQCIDFLTILRMRELSKLFERKYSTTERTESPAPV